MNRHRVVCCAVIFLVGGCGADGTLEPAGALPLKIHAMKASYACAARDPGEESDLMRQMRQMQELNMSFNLQPFYRLVTAMVADPFAEEWELTHDYNPNIDVRISLRARPLEKSESGAIFRIDTLAEGYRPAASCGAVVCPDEPFATEDVAYGTSTPVASSIDLGSVSLRWNDLVLEAFTWRCGCDPATGISFQQGEGLPTECWDLSGQLVSCAGVNLWPE